MLENFRAPPYVSEIAYLERLQEQTVFSGGNREGETPDPIPNSVVKTFFADGTAHKSVGE